MIFSLIKSIFYSISAQYNGAIYIFVRAIDAHSLMGYIGGYVGLLLGFSILQVPDFGLFAFEKMKMLYFMYVMTREMPQSINETE